MKVILQKKANKFRERNGLSASEPIRMKSLLLRLKILTMYKPLKGNFSGMCLKINNNAKFILLNSSHSIGRQHFTIAHELYHLYEQENFEIHQCKTGIFDKKNKEEYNADFFASCLLMPESGIYELVPDEELKLNKISLKTIIKLEQFYSVSRSSMLIRLKELDLIDNSKYDEIKKLKVTESALLYGYDTSIYKSGNHDLFIGDYGEKAKFLFDKEKISEGHYLELMLKIGIDITNIKDEPEN